MARLFRDRTIEKRVMAVVRDAIEEAQHEQRLTEIVEAGVKKVFARLK